MSNLTPIEIPYPNKDDRNKRLNSVFCVYKGKHSCISTLEHPQYPLDVSEVFILPHTPYAEEIPWSSQERKKITYVDNPDLNIFDISLGYMDTSHGPICLSRHPARSTSVGITQYNVCDITGKHGKSRIGFYFYKEPFFNMINDNYSKSFDAWERVRSGQTFACSISKDLCLMEVEPGLYGLYRRGILLGITTGLNPTFSVLDSRKKLSRVYEDDILATGLRLT